MAKRKTIHAWTDGSCYPNPGPGGWGVLLVCGQYKTSLWGAAGYEVTTNGRMEIQAAIEALRATECLRKHHLAIHSDAKYVIDTMNEGRIVRWRAGGWKTVAGHPVQNKDLWLKLEMLARSRSVEWVWVKGHSGDPGNEAADALALRGREASAEDHLPY